MSLTTTCSFRWDDALAPALSGTAGALASILKQCLVGVAGLAYGSKASAGWTVAFEDIGTNKIVFRNALAAGGTGCYLRVDDSNAQYAIIQCYESMSDIDTGVSPAASAVRYIPKSNAASGASRLWVICADERTAYGCVNVAGATTPTVPSYGSMASWAAGDPDPYIVGDPSCLIAGSTSTSTASNIPCAIGTRSLAFSATDTGLSLSRDTAFAAIPTLMSFAVPEYNFSNPSTSSYRPIGSELIAPGTLPGFSGHVAVNAILAGGGTLRGRMRGVFAPLTGATNTTVSGSTVIAAGRPGASVMAVLAGMQSDAIPRDSWRLFVETVLPWE